MAAVTFVQNAVFAVESPVNLVEGESITFSCTYWATPSSPSAKVYKKKTDVTTTNMPSGSASVTGWVVTLPQLTALAGTNRYVVNVQATVGGDVKLRKIEVLVQRAGAEQ